MALHKLLEPLEIVGCAAELELLLIPLVVNTLTTLLSVERQANAEGPHLAHHMIFEEMELGCDVPLSSFDDLSTNAGKKRPGVPCQGRQLILVYC